MLTNGPVNGSNNIYVVILAYLLRSCFSDF